MYPRFSPDAMTPWKGPTGGGRASGPDEVPGGVGLLPQEHCHTHKYIVSNLQHKLHPACIYLATSSDWIPSSEE